jgi:hypothetical protein
MTGEIALVEINESQRIRPGDHVELIYDPCKEYVVREDEDGNLVVKGRNKWGGFTDSYPPAVFHRHYRKVVGSPALRFIGLFMHKQRQTSANKRHTLYYRVLCLAIEANMRFDEDDFAALSDKGFGGFVNEDFYRLVVESGNKTAVTALEHYTGREPFLWYDRDSLDKGKGGEILIACHQERETDERGWTRKVLTRRVFKLSHGDLDHRHALDLRLRSLGAKLGELAPLPRREIAHTDKDRATELYLCPTRAEAEWGPLYPHTVFDFDLDAIEAECPRCHTPFYTNPGPGTMLAALVEMEAAVGPGQRDDSLLRKLRAIGALGGEIALAERVIALAEKVLGEF